MTEPYTTNLASQIVSWVLGVALFFSVGFLPNLLLAWFYTGGEVHLVVVPTVAAILGLFWVAGRLLPSPSR